MVAQDFEIAGSGGAGGRSPAGTELTERSWDSHAQYLREPPRPPEPLAPLYCRPAHLLTERGLCTLIIIVSTSPHPPSPSVWDRINETNFVLSV